MTFALGVTASLAAPLIMTLGFLVWEHHWQGSAFALNLFKCNVASVGFLILAVSTRRLAQEEILDDAVFTTRAVGYLFLSSTIGIVIGDWTWLQALQILGAQRVIFMDSLKPFLAAVLGWLVLDEELRLAALGGIVLTVAGVVLVAVEKEQPTAIVVEEQTDCESGTDNAVDKPAPPLLDLQRDGSLQLNETEHSVDNDKDNTPLTLSVPTLSQTTAERDSDDRNDNPVRPEASLPESSEKDENSDIPESRNNLRLGYAMSILNVGLDTYGAVLIKEHGVRMTVWEINLLRFGFAGVVMLCPSVIMRLWTTAMPRNVPIPQSSSAEPSIVAEVEPKTLQTPWYCLPLDTMTRSNWGHVLVGVLLVTFLTPALTNYALFQIALALALTLGSVGPLYSLPLVFWYHHKAPTLTATLGAVLAVAGIVILAFRGTLENNGADSEL
jgi:drug/metabolite transporter (DMT)-like permease